MIDEGGNIGWCKPYKDEKGVIKMAISQCSEGGWEIVGLQIEGEDTKWTDEEIERASKILKNTYPNDYDRETPMDILDGKVCEEMDCRDCPWFLECEAMDD